VQRLFSGYRLRGSDPALQLAERALRSLGREPVRISTGGGADANAFRARGFACVNLANGTERAHQPTERVGSGALEEGLALCRALVREAGGHSEEVR
jgi:tripeptide aminopeptidase